MIMHSLTLDQSTASLRLDLNNNKIKINVLKINSYFISNENPLVQLSKTSKIHFLLMLVLLKMQINKNKKQKMI